MATRLPEGHPDEAGGPTNPQGIFNPRIGAENAGAIGGRKRELPTAVYRWDPSGKLDVAIAEEQLPDPNGICFSPDYKTAVRDQHRQRPGRHRAGWQRLRSMRSTCRGQSPSTSGCSPT